jgi:HEAT repeat protein
MREALCGRLTDDDVDTREEALVGLSKRHDQRIVPHLIDALAQSDISYRVVEAAHTLLGLDMDQEEWSGQDYARALQARFSGMSPQRF